MARQATKVPGMIFSFDSLWWGISVGGRHYTGHVNYREGSKQEYKRHEIERKLSFKEAKLLDPNNGERYWKRGVARTTNRFDDIRSLERAASKWVADYCAHADHVHPIYILIDNNIHNPNRPIAAQGWDKQRLAVMTDLAACWDLVPDHKREGEVWDTMYAAWHKLTKATGPLS